MQMSGIVVEKSEADVAREVARFWWLLGLLGLVSMIAGVIFVAQPSHSLSTLAVVFGIFLLLDGTVELVSSFWREDGHRALAAILGVLGIIIGIILIRHPTHAVSAIGLIIGIWLVAAGVVRLVRAVVLKVNLFLSIAIAILEIVVGIVVVSDPHIGYTALAILVGIWLIINAVGLMGMAVALRSIKAEPGASTSP